MKINASLHKLLIAFCTLSIVMILFIFYLSNWISWENHFTFIMVISTCVLVLCIYFKVTNNVKDESTLFKQQPVKLQLPFNFSSVMWVNYNLGFFLFIVSIISMVITSYIWLTILCIFILWNLVFNHPNIWLKDSIDLEQSKQAAAALYNERMSEVGVFEYIEKGFIYRPDAQHQVEHMLWEDILSIDVVRQNFGLEDEIQLYLLSTKTIIKISENTKGYFYFLEQMHQQFADINEIWQLLIIADGFGEPYNIYKK